MYIYGVQETCIRRYDGDRIANMAFLEDTMGSVAFCILGVWGSLITLNL